MKTILVTGGAGFIGSNFIIHMLKHYDYHIINLDTLTYAGDLAYLKEVESSPCYTFVKGDIRDRKLVDQLFQKNEIDTVVNFAAESHVDRSIEEPEVFITTNVLGTQVLLDTAKKYWKVEPDNKYSRNFAAESHVDRSIEEPEVFITTNVLGTQVLLDTAKKYWKVEPDNKYSRSYKAGVKFLQISTDEVYGTLGKEGIFTELTPLAPNSPYSASKASADMMVRAYHETFGLPINITRCSNNYGPHQHTEKLIPLMISRCKAGLELPVYGDGMQIRDWLYVEDHCRAIDAVLHKGKDGEIYNIGGNNEKANIDIVKWIIKALNQSEELIRYVQDRPGHDRRYAIDNTKIKAQLGWQPLYTFEEGIEKTLNYYR